MKRLPILYFLPLMVVLSACEAENEILSSALFDESAIGPRELEDDTVIRNGTFLIEDDVQITDTGGFSNYRNSERIVMVIRPKETGGRVVLDLYQFESEYDGGGTCTEDYLTIYNGVGTSSPRLDQWCGTFNNFFLPWRFVAQNAAGALTLEWRSDASVTFAGFYGQLSVMESFQNYAVYGLRTTSFGGSAFRAIYETAGPLTAMQSHGICHSTTLSSPSRTNGATCGTASANRFGTTSWNISNATVFTTYFVRAYLVQPGGTTIYSSTSTVVPSTKAMPDFTGFGGAPQVGDVIELDS